MIDSDDDGVVWLICSSGEYLKKRVFEPGGGHQAYTPYNCFETRNGIPLYLPPVSWVSVVFKKC